MKSSIQHVFAQVPSADIPRSSFDRTHGYKTTFSSGYLVPVFCDEALPGDTFTLDLTAFVRMATPIYPVMDNLYLDTHFFFVPYRLLRTNWERFNGAQDNPGASTDYLVPKITAPVGGYATGSLYDYLGLPTKVAGFDHSALPLRAYNLIYNEWFRDENLQNSVLENVGDGPDDPSNFVLLRRGKRHDYFTSALPWPQKGPAVNLPLGTSAPVVLGPGASGNTPTMRYTAGGIAPAGALSAFSGGGIQSAGAPGAAIGLDPFLISSNTDCIEGSRSSTLTHANS